MKKGSIPNGIKTEILSPAGSYESLFAAIKGGADRIYFGINALNMRARLSHNFTLKDIKKISSICKEEGLKSCIAVNTIVYDKDIPLMKKILDTAKKNSISGVIVSDIAAIEYARSIDQAIHISTLLNISNIEAVKFFAKYADVMVLARELSLNQIKQICKEIQSNKITGPSGELVKVEIFAHGALCVAISGKCYMSLATYDSSANRGACVQNCRRKYRVIDEETGQELIIENNFVMSPKDLLTIGIIDKIIDAGVSILKIEGRVRKAEYVYTVTKAYREAVDSVYEGSFNEKKIEQWKSDLKQVYNRGFWDGGYYLGKRLGDWSGVNGSKATKKKKFIGTAIKYYQKSGMGEFSVEAGTLSVGDEIIITGTTTGMVSCVISSIYVDGEPRESAEKGEDKVTIPISDKIRPKDKLYLFQNRKDG